MTVPALLAPEPGPRTLVDKRWGGARLGALRGAPGRTIGESWEFSTLPGVESQSLGRSLAALLGRELEFLAKLIDTSLPLSIQVHPPADPARGWPGKEEAWVVLDAEPDAAAWVGLAPGVSASELARRVRDAAAGAGEGPLVAALRRVPLQRGSVVLVPSGTVHSIGAGVLLAEIQQPADLTRRLYDWGSERALQVDEALASIDPAGAPQVWQPHEAPRVLLGAHLELAVLGPGAHSFEVRGDTLVISVEGSCELGACGERVRADPAGLRLCTRGPLSVRVERGGLAVVGSMLH